MTKPQRKGTGPTNLVVRADVLAPDAYGATREVLEMLHGIGYYDGDPKRDLPTMSELDAILVAAEVLYEERVRLGSAFELHFTGKSTAEFERGWLIYIREFLEDVG